MKLLEITRGLKVKLDKADYLWISQYSWFVYEHHGTTYAAREIKRNGKRGLLKMHRAILGVIDPSIQVDHLNGDGLDNRRCNLRLASPIEQRFNSKVRKDNTSGYPGVYYRKDTGHWQVNTGDKSLMTFDTKEEAISCRISWEEGTNYVFRR